MLKKTFLQVFIIAPVVLVVGTFPQKCVKGQIFPSKWKDPSYLQLHVEALSADFTSRDLLSELKSVDGLSLMPEHRNPSNERLNLVRSDLSRPMKRESTGLIPDLSFLVLLFGELRLHVEIKE